MTAAGRTFIWGLKRSGIHHVVNWLYANQGGVTKGPLEVHGLHPQLCDGFADSTAGVAFFNNCGRFHSRQFELGDITPSDFIQAARSRRSTLFGIEDSRLPLAARTEVGPDVAHVLVLRDPLNNLASRLEAARTRPELFPVNEDYVDLYAEYCTEYLGQSSHLPAKTVVSYNRFVEDRAYRDGLAAELGVVNLDIVSEVSPYGGGSSFSAGDRPSDPSSLMTRFRQHPIPAPLLDMLLDRPAVREICTSVFGYDLSQRAEEA